MRVDLGAQEIVFALEEVPFQQQLLLLEQGITLFQLEPLPVVFYPLFFAVIQLSPLLKEPHQEEIAERKNEEIRKILDNVIAYILECIRLVINIQPHAHIHIIDPK